MSRHRARSPLALLLLLVASPSPADEPRFEAVDLFGAGTAGYAHYRIPGVVATPRGTLLAYCEARKEAKGDWGAIDLFARRSADGGKTWGPPRKLASPPGDAAKNPVALKQGLGKPGEFTLNNPVAIVEPKTGTLHLLYCLEYARCFALRSDDDGETFSGPVEITPAFEAFRPEYDWKVLATGPGHGIALATGRLVVPVWLSTGTGGHAHRPSAVATIVSDDHGRTWTRGAIVVADPEPSNPSETAAVELADGRVMLNIRHESAPRLRAVVTGPDGATGWSRPRFDAALPDPICFGSLARLSRRPEADKDRLLFVNPHNPNDRRRRNLTVKLSDDEGRTWRFARAVEPGPSGYADLAVTPDHTICCFYEHGTVDGRDTNPRSLRLARFNVEWLAAGRDAIRPGRRNAIPTGKGDATGPR